MLSVLGVHCWAPYALLALLMPCTLQSESDRRLASSERKEKRQGEQLEALRSRLHDLEATQAEREEEVKALRRSLRQQELAAALGLGD